LISHENINGFAWSWAVEIVESQKLGWWDEGSLNLQLSTQGRDSGARKKCRTGKVQSGREGQWGCEEILLVVLEFNSGSGSKVGSGAAGSADNTDWRIEKRKKVWERDKDVAVGRACEWNETEKLSRLVVMAVIQICDSWCDVFHESKHHGCDRIDGAPSASTLRLYKEVTLLFSVVWVEYPVYHNYLYPSDHNIIKVQLGILSILSPLVVQHTTFLETTDSSLTNTTLHISPSKSLGYNGANIKFSNYIINSGETLLK
jgi:hypothetical protein